MKKRIILVLGLMSLSISNVLARDLDDKRNLNKLINKKSSVWVKAIGDGSALLHGTVLEVNESSMTMLVKTVGESHSYINDNPFFLAVLGNNIIGKILITNDGTIVTFSKNCVLLAEVKRSGLMRALSFWILPKDKDIYARTDILEKSKISNKE